MRILTALALLSLASTSACAGKADFPSLARRPIESQSGAAAPAPPPPAAPQTAITDPALIARLNAAVRKAELGDAEFQAALSSAQSAVNAARNAAFASESWIAAQMAISALERARAPFKMALSDFDAEVRAIVERDSNTPVEVFSGHAASLAGIDLRHQVYVDNLLNQLRKR